MRKIAIVGAGPVGLHLAFTLLKENYEVTVFNDKTPEQYAQSKLMNTAAFFKDAQEKERELGLNFWDDVAPRGRGIHLEVHTPDGETISKIEAKFGGGQLYAEGIDYRIKIPKWMEEFQKRGGNLVIRAISKAHLAELADQYDLVFVAVGKADLRDIFPRDDERSVFTEAPRYMGVLLLKGEDLLSATAWPEVGFPHLRLHTVIGIGDIFSIPMYTYPGIEARGFAFEAIPGGPFDIFRHVKSGEELLEIGKALTKQYVPGDLEALETASLADPLGWIAGSVIPTIRKPAARLESGKYVMGLGDVLMLTDPLAGQGANNGIRMAHYFAKRIVEQGKAPFTPDWMQEVFDMFYEEEGKYPIDFTNILLQEPPEALVTVLAAASTNQKVADVFATKFTYPKSCWPWIEDVGEAKKLVASLS